MSNDHLYVAVSTHLKKEMIFIAKKCDDNDCKRFTFFFEISVQIKGHIKNELYAHFT